MNEIFIATFILGITGSFHCVGMCGPLILAANSKNTNYWAGLTMYHLGRIITYGFLGLLLGLMGAGFQLAGVQQWVSIAAGAILLGSLIVSLYWGRGLELVITGRFLTWLKQQFSRFLGGNRIRDKYMLGMLNGFLPCGLVYVALATALAANSVLESTASMIIFGLATLPILAVFSSLGRILGKRFTSILKVASPVLIAIVGCLLILRGMDLGIPFISPKLPGN